MAERRFDSYGEFYLNSAYGGFEQEHRAVGSLGVHQIRVDQTALDLVDPAVPEYVFIRIDNACTRPASVDLGDGPRWFRGCAPGTFHLVPPGTEAGYRIQEDNRLSIVSMPAEAVDRLLDEAGVRTPDPFGHLYASATSCARVSDLVDRMWQVGERAGPAANLWLDGLTLQLLAALAERPALSPSTAAATDERRVHRAIEYLETRLDAAPTVAELARAAELDEARFVRAFRSTTGRTVWEYVEERCRARATGGRNGGEGAAGPRPGRPDRRLVRAADYAEAHLGTALTVGELASVATMSRSGFARAVRAAHGEPVWSWVQGRRVERALELLRGTAMPIEEVACRCGFASQSHLTSVVKGRTGLTPGAVRRG